MSTGARGRTTIVTSERWLCAPYADISFEHGQSDVTGTETPIVFANAPSASSAVNCTSKSSRLATPETGAVLRTKNGNAISIRPPGASSRTTSSSTNSRNPATVQRRGARCRALFQQLDEPRHVRALSLLGQRHVDIARRDRRLRRAPPSENGSG